jgi:hypothetical protein
VFRGQTGADLEERLSVAFSELVQDRPPRRIGQRLKDISHCDETICKSLLACQGFDASRRGSPVAELPAPLMLVTRKRHRLDERTGSDDDDLIVKRTNGVDYWDGEG